MSKKTVALSAAVSGVLGLVIGSAIGGADTTSADPNPTTSATSDANHLFDSSDSPTVDAPPVADPSGTYSSSCDYVLGDFSDNTASGFRFVAQAVIKNTGNIGTVDTVTARWFQAGTAPVVASKTVKVLAGSSKRVGLTEEVSQDQIDLIQSLGYGDNCKVKVTIGDTFGSAS
jgi:hypothetical protein